MKKLKILLALIPYYSETPPHHRNKRSAVDRSSKHPSSPYSRPGSHIHSSAHSSTAPSTDLSAYNTLSTSSGSAVVMTMCVEEEVFNLLSSLHLFLSTFIYSTTHPKFTQPYIPKSIQKFTNTSIYLYKFHPSIYLSI